MKVKFSNGGGQRVNKDECKVTTSGISHLFDPYELGAYCECGRKVVAEDDEGGLTVRGA